jgi:FkbM family methyltransferase
LGLLVSDKDSPEGEHVNIVSGGNGSAAAEAGSMNTQSFSKDDLKVWLTRFPWLYSRARRPYATARYLLRRPHDIDYAAFGLFPQTDGLFLDLGANAGMSSMSLRIYQRRAHILAIEPNPFHEPDLRWAKRVVGRMDYRIWAVGDEPGEAEFFIPVYRGVPITTEASLTRQFVLESPSLRDKFGERMDSSDFEIVHIRVDVHRIDDLSLAPALVKIDVQGHEQPALSGMSQTLESYGPPVLVEAPSSETKAFMASLGYGAYRYDPAPSRLVALGDEDVTNVLFARELPAGATT